MKESTVVVFMERIRDIMTPEQAADYLQVNRETVYRYIKQGKLVASRLGRSYRIPRRNLDVLLWSSTTRPDITLRDYSPDAIAGFLRDDELDAEGAAIAKRFRRRTAAD
jgi:excisionase family DNA binding protein